MSYTNALELADRHVTEILGILRVMGERGLRVDMHRLDEFKADMRQRLDIIQSKLDSSEKLMPLRGFHPKAGYKRTPKSLDGLELSSFDGVERWARRLSFNPGSNPQVKSYMKHVGHLVADTTDGKLLALYWRRFKDDNYKLFVDYRKIVKLLSTYGEWPLTERNGEFYATTMFTLRPDTGRLSSVAPNIQNIPKRGVYAKGFRRCIVARPGRQLVRADLGSAEAIIIAWLTGDRFLMRLARLGMHNYAMSMKLGLDVDLNLPDDELKKIFAERKDANKELYNVVKIAVYGSFYLAGPRTLFEKNPEDFESQKEAKQFQTLVFDAIPQIKRWQDGVVNKTFVYGADGRNWGWAGNRLFNPFGYSKEFWDIPGQDGPAACAMLPQSTIACVMKEAMLELWQTPAAEYMTWQIHDELVLDTPLVHVPRTKEILEQAMGQPWPQLNGLSIPVEIKISEDMS